MNLQGFMVFYVSNDFFFNTLSGVIDHESSQHMAHVCMCPFLCVCVFQHRLRRAVFEKKIKKKNNPAACPAPARLSAPPLQPDRSSLHSPRSAGAELLGPFGVWQGLTVMIGKLGNI